MSAILGVNCVSHNSSAALVIDGEPVASVQQERFDRRKQSAAFPDTAIEYCLQHLNGRPLDYVAVPLDPGLSAGRTIGRLTADLPHAREAFRWAIDYYARLADNLSRLHRLGVASERVRYVGHHEAHLASAFYTGPYRDAALLSVDGSGDDNTATWAHGTPDGIKVLDSVRMPASLGYFYGAITEYLGFIPNVDEGKVMGLAPYGQPSLVEEFVELLTPGPYGTFHLDLCYFNYHRRPQRMYSAALEDRFGPPRTPKSTILPRHENIAHAAQALRPYSCRWPGMLSL